MQFRGSSLRTEMFTIVRSTFHVHQWLQSLCKIFELKDSCTNNSYTKRRCFQGVSTEFWIRPAIWLHSVHDIAVPISRSPQRSWWGLVLAETCPAQQVILHNIQTCFIREMRFVDCSCMYKHTHIPPGKFFGKLATLRSLLWPFWGNTKANKETTNGW